MSSPGATISRVAGNREQRDPAPARGIIVIVRLSLWAKRRLPHPVKGVKRPRAESAEGKTPALGDHQARDLLTAPGDETVKEKRDCVSTPEGRIANFNIAVIEASIKVTSTSLLSDNFNAQPVSDDKFFAKLLSMRASSGNYIGGSAPLAPFLGFEMVKAVIPDEALQRLSISDIIEYRRKSADAYQAWEADINRLAAKMDKVKFEKAQSDIPKLIARELKPQVGAAAPHGR
jgi:hypothetical protein